MKNGRLIVLLSILLLVGCGKQEVQTEKKVDAGVIKTELSTTKATLQTGGKIRTKESVQAKRKSLGTFKITGYCSCSKCCGKWAYNRPNGVVYGASGEKLAPNHSVAVDTSVIPYGTILIINGKEYVAQDRGGRVKGNHIDIYFESHEEAYAVGLQYEEVFIEVSENE